MNMVSELEKRDVTRSKMKAFVLLQYTCDEINNIPKDFRTPLETSILARAVPIMEGCECREDLRTETFKRNPLCKAVHHQTVPSDKGVAR